MVAIEFKNFSAFYKNKKDFITALDNISFSVLRGELVSVVGESGSGKTTLLKSCLGLAPYFEGDIVIEGQAVESIDFKNANFAYVSQEIALYPNLTVYENIAFPLRVMRTPPREVDERVKKMANEMNISLLLTRKPRQLSGGQQQRVALARALIKNPDIIYFDEPFSGLEPALRSEMQLLIKTIHEKYKATVLFVTHNLDEAFNLSDRIAVIEEGRLTEIGTPEELENNAESHLIRGYFDERNRLW